MMSGQKLKKGIVTFLRSHRQQDTELASSPKGLSVTPATSESITVALSARKPCSHFTHSLSALAKACRAWGLGGCSSPGRRKAGGSW